MTTNKSPRFFFSWFDLIMGSILLTLLVGGLFTGFYLYHSVRTFVAESQLVIFPVVNIGPDGLPRVVVPAPDLGPDKAPSDDEPPIDPVATPELAAADDGTPQAEGTQAPRPTSTPIVLFDPEAEEHEDEDQITVTPDSFSPSAATERLTVLVMGIDRRENEQEGPWRTDSMILISIDPKSESIAILSTPRDLFVTIPNYGNGEYRDRINTAFFYGDLTEYPGGGAALAKETIRRNFGIAVDRHLVLDFNGFERIVDALGGIEVDVPKQIIDTGYPTEDNGYMTIRFDPGLQRMTGERALIYSRTRKSTSDFDRAARQQQVIMAIRNQVLSKNLIALLTPTKLSELYLALEDSIQTDITLDEVLSLAQVANRVTEKNIKRLVIGPNMVSNYTTNQGAQVLVPDWDIILPQTKETFGIPLLGIAPHPVVLYTWSPTPIPRAAPLTVATPVYQSTLVPVGNNNSNNNNNNNNSNNNNRVGPTFTVGAGTPWPTFTSSTTPSVTLVTGKGTPWPTFTPSNGTPWPTFTPSNGTLWPTFTPSNGTPWPTFTPSNGTPWPTFTPSNGTPWPTFTPSNGTPWPTFTPSNGTPWPTFTASNGTPWPTFTPSNGTPWPTFTASNATPWPTFTASNATPWPTLLPSSSSTPEPIYATEVPTPDDIIYEEATPVYQEATPIPEESSYEPTTVIEDLAAEVKPVLEELSYETTPIPESSTYELTVTPQQP